MKRMMKRLSLCLLISSVFGIGTGHSQTCRVHTGCDARGVKQYMEVYQYDYVTEKPEFPGGDLALMQFINTTRVYPSKAYKKGIEGRVTCGFVINTDGSVSHVKVIRGVEKTLDNEAKRVFSEMPTWRPGSVNGKVVPVHIVRSVCFRR